MFKNWFKTTNAKRIEDQIEELRDDIVLLQKQVSELMNKQEPIIDQQIKEPILESVLEPRIEKEELISVVIDPTSILEPTHTIKSEHSLDSLIVKEDEINNLLENDVHPPSDNILEKVLEPVITVDKETNTVPKKRRQSKKVAQLEEALPKMTV